MAGIGKATGEGGGALVGIGTSAEPTIEGFDFTKLTPSEQLAKVKELQGLMGQTGDEAGKYNLPHGSSEKMYVNCSKSFDINYYLATGKVGSPQSSWTNAGYGLSGILSDIKKMDSGMKPLTESVKGYKYAEGNALGRMLGMDNITNSNIQQLINTLETDNVAKQDFATKLKDTSYTHKGYTSVSYIPQHSTYDSMPIRLDFVLQKGTKAIVTNNTPEHEIVGDRNVKYNFTGKYKVENVYSTAKGGYVKQLVIECYV